MSWRVIHGDCLEEMPKLTGQADVVITDPPWPGYEHIGLAGGSAADVEPLWHDFGVLLPDVCRRAIIVLSNLVDPRILRHIPKSLPFLTMIWMRIIPPRYRGNVLQSADVAYVFGDGFLSVPGSRVLPAEHTCQPSLGGRTPDNDHPCYRTQSGMDFLVGRFSKPGMTILDPFCGSGNIGIAAATQGRRFIGIETEEKYADMSNRRINEAARQKDMFR